MAVPRARLEVILLPATPVLGTASQEGAVFVCFEDIAYSTEVARMRAVAACAAGASVREGVLQLSLIHI